MGTIKSRAPEKPKLNFAEKSQWAAWLARNHSTASGAWLRLAKKGSGLKSVSPGEALDVALCFGWIDGQAKSDDDRYWLVKFTPRGRRSLWSKRNREKALALIADGEMKPAGLAEVERAKTDGRWEAAYDPPSSMIVPPDLRAALAQNKRAERFFGTLNGRNRYAILFRIQTAGKDETRTKRIQQFVQMLSRGEKLYP